MIILVHGSEKVNVNVESSNAILMVLYASHIKIAFAINLFIFYCFIPKIMAEKNNIMYEITIKSTKLVLH